MSTATLLGTLESIRRRAKALSVLYGVGLLAAAAAGLLVTLVLVDWALNLPNWPRIVLVLAALGAMGYALWRWVVAPLRREMSLSDVAGHVETAFPQFDDRLRSTVGFSTSGDPESAVMKDRVMAEAAAMADRVNLYDAVVAKPAYQSLAGGAAAVLLLVLLALFAFSPATLSVIAGRLLTPWNAPAWPRRVQIALDGNVPARVAAGDRVNVSMKLKKGDSANLQPVVYYKTADGAVQQQFLTRGADGTYSASLDARLEQGAAAAPLAVWIVAGDDRADFKPITVVPRLAATAVTLEVSPPPYAAGRPKQSIDLPRQAAVVGEGSAVSLKVTFNKRLNTKYKSLAPGTPPPPAPASLLPAATEGDHGAEQAKVTLPDYKVTFGGTSDTVATFTFVAARSARFRVNATDADGFSNMGLAEYELVVRPDQQPTIQIENPRRNEDRTADSTVPLTGVAEDDYGFSTVKLVVNKLGDAPRQWEIPLVNGQAPQGGASWTADPSAGADRVRDRLAYDWTLADLQGAALKPGDVLEYFLQVQDNYNLNGKFHAPAVSGKLRIAIISQDDLNAQVIDALRQVREQTEATARRQERTEQETGDLKNDLKKGEFDEAAKTAAERLVRQQSAAASTAKQLAEQARAALQRLEENKSPSTELKDLSQTVAEQLDAAAEGPMKDANGDLDQSARPDAKKPDREKDLDAAQEHQKEAVAQLNKAVDRMSNIGTLQTTIAEVAKLLQKQQAVSKQTKEAGEGNLGKKPEDLSPEDKKKLDAAADAQKKLADEVDKAVEKMGKTAEQMKQSDPASSDAMKKAASQAKSQQVSQSQRKAAESAKQNQQADAQQQQQKVELGLEMVLNNLREAERQKLAELQKKLTDLQEQLANLIRRQAGHNLDTVELQGPPKAAAVGPDTIKNLTDLAKRGENGGDVKNVVDRKPDAAAVTTGQAQTERNARDIGKSTEEVPGLSDAAGRLTRAASRMERAVVELRGNKLAEAYDPSQVDALDALIQAQKAVDQKQAETEKQIADQQKDAIRERYVKIKADQDALNKKVADIDSRRDKDGNLARADALQANRTPGEQGELSDRVTAMDEDLAALGSVVYVWANKDLSGRMNAVKEELGKQETGKPVQAEQAAVVEQLAQMIDHLKAEEKKQDFEEKKGGGGGGGGAGGPKMPTVVELQLMKDLQKQLNGQTAAAAKAKPVDADQTLRLGKRQGELRDLLDQLLKAASQGKAGLGPEPDNRDLLPEEADAKAVDKGELVDDLLGDKGDAKPGDKTEKEMAKIGDRMARSRQRLALNQDAGKVTQIIQDRIVTDFDGLIAKAKEQQKNAQSKPGSGKPQGPPKPELVKGKPQNEGKNKPGQPAPKPGQEAAQDSNAGPPGQQANLGKDIRSTAQDWGATTPRVRDAIIEGANEDVVETYRKLSEDYWRGLAEKASEK